MYYICLNIHQYGNKNIILLNHGENTRSTLIKTYNVQIEIKICPSLTSAPVGHAIFFQFDMISVQTIQVCFGM